jgi:hypothetical protein
MSEETSVVSKSQDRQVIHDVLAQYNPTTNTLKASVKVTYSVQSSKLLGKDADGNKVYEKARPTTVFKFEGSLRDAVVNMLTKQPLLITTQNKGRGKAPNEIMALLDGKTLDAAPKVVIAVRTPEDIMQGVLDDPELRAGMSEAEVKAAEKMIRMLKAKRA